MTGDLNTDRSKWKNPGPLLAEILRPKVLSDLTLPTPTIERLQRVIETGWMVNLLFRGPIGSGKTGAARIFMDAIGGYMTIDHSSETRPKLAKYIKDLLVIAVPIFALLTRPTLFRNMTKQPCLILSTGSAIAVSFSQQPMSRS